MANRYANAKKVHHGNLRADRPTHGRRSELQGPFCFKRVRVSVSECHGSAISWR
jgi:hypothetical protein